MLIVCYYCSKESKSEGLLTTTATFRALVDSGFEKDEYPLVEQWKKPTSATKSENIQWYNSLDAFYDLRLNFLDLQPSMRWKSDSEIAAANVKNAAKMRDILKNMDSVPRQLDVSPGRNGEEAVMGIVTSARIALGLPAHTDMLIALEANRRHIPLEQLTREKYPLIYKQMLKTLPESVWHQGQARTKAAAKLLEAFDQELAKIDINKRFKPIRLRARVYKIKSNYADIEISHNQPKMTEWDYIF